MPRSAAASTPHDAPCTPTRADALHAEGETACWFVFSIEDCRALLKGELTAYVRAQVEGTVQLYDSGPTSGRTD